MKPRHLLSAGALVLMLNQCAPECAPEGLTNNHPDRWRAIAQCESGSNWSMHVHNSHGWFGGGLAIMDTVWVHYGGQEFAVHGGLATQAEQIEIAERIRADVGWGAWQCA